MRIDAARKQLLEPRVDARAAERFFHQRVEAESREMALVEHDRMTQRDRLRVIRVVCEEVEQRARARAVPAVPCKRRRWVESHPVIVR